MILAIDCGNSRLKWGLHVGARIASGRPAEAFAAPDPRASWRETGAVSADALQRLEEDWRGLPQPGAIVIANVAGPEAREALARALHRFNAEPQWLRARPVQCGVTNAYANPEQLGPDRWAALVAARHINHGPSLVVSAGTATTVDLLSASGLFRGGVILPGLELMKQSLASGTAELPLARGEFSDEPRNTADAMESGCLHAQAGAIERMYGRLEPGGLCLLTGGAALRIAARLAIPVRVVENLVLEGLVQIARS